MRNSWIKITCLMAILFLTVSSSNANQLNNSFTVVPYNKNTAENNDSDGDGLSDSRERWWLCDPTDKDTNDDGILDGDSVDFFSKNKTWPYKQEDLNDDNDVDGDGLPTAAEMYDTGTEFKIFSTDGDPYGDGQEYFDINMPKISPADHPLVAAYPDLSVRLTRIKVTPIEDITSSTGQAKQHAWSISRETSESSKTSIELGSEQKISISASQEAKVGTESGVSTSISVSGEVGFHQTVVNENTLTATKSKSNSGWTQGDWSTARSNKSAEAANLALTLNVKNSGTIPAEVVTPDVNIKLGNKIIASIRSPTTINSIDIGETSKDFLVDQGVVGNNPVDITTSLEQLRFIDAGTPLSIETLQVSARMKKWDGDKNEWVLLDQDVSTYMNEINRRSATLMFELDGGVYKKYKVFTDSEYAPMTLGKAINLTIDRDKVPPQKTNGTWTFGFPEEAFSEVSMILDKNGSIYDLKLRPGWKIVIKAQSDKPEPEIHWVGYSQTTKTIYASITDDLQVKSVVAHVNIEGTYQDLNMTDLDGDTVYTLQLDQVEEALGFPWKDSKNKITAEDIEGYTVVSYITTEDFTFSLASEFMNDSSSRELEIEGSEENDMFGFSIAVGDFNNDGFDDLAIGVPGESIRGNNSSGAVNILYGSPSSNGLSQEITSEILGIKSDPEPGDKFGFSLAVGDFDNDSCDDLAVGVPNRTIRGNSDAGAVSILYGSPKGLEAAVLYQNPGIIDPKFKKDPGPGDQFGFSVAAGDFDNDGFDDLAIGVPGAMPGLDLDSAGAVNIRYGSSSGLKKENASIWYQDPKSDAEAGDQFGFSLAVGDFDNDSCDDLAVGVPNRTISGKSDAGAVSILYGSSNGLNKEKTSEMRYQQIQGKNHSETNDRFGFSVATGDFDNNGFDDLAVGAPGETVKIRGSYHNAAGAVNILNGSSSGLSITSDMWYQSREIEDDSESKDQFGFSVAAGDFDNDGFDDLAIGVPGEGLFDVSNAGVVNILYSTFGGLKKFKSQELWHQENMSTSYDTEPNDQFGFSVATGDFDNDGFDDLAIGVPGEEVSSKSNAGAVNILYGSSTGLKFLKDTVNAWYQDIMKGSVVQLI